MTFFRFYSFSCHRPECEENYGYILGHIGLIVPSSHLNSEDMPLMFWKGVPWGNVAGQDCVYWWIDIHLWFWNFFVGLSIMKAWKWYFPGFPGIVFGSTWKKSLSSVKLNGSDSPFGSSNECCIITIKCQASVTVTLWWSQMLIPLGWLAIGVSPTPQFSQASCWAKKKWYRPSVRKAWFARTEEYCR